MFKQPRITTPRSRAGAALVWVTMILVIVFAFAAFTVDIGYMAITKAELQNTADASALGSVVVLSDGEDAVKNQAIRIAAANQAAESSVTLEKSDIEIGFYNMETRTFEATSRGPNAVRVTAWQRDNSTIFGPVIGQDSFTSRAHAVAMLNPRDIVFLIDLSGSMNDDTEPCWATDAINAEYGPSGFGSVATGLMQDIFDDFGFGNFPGTITNLGSPLGVPANEWAYPEMTKDNGPLTSLTIPASYRIANTDSEDVRRTKAYSWIIDYQIASVMPAALPAPDSSRNFVYWSSYLDYILAETWTGTEPPPEPDDGEDGGGSTGGGGSGSSGGSPRPRPPKTIGSLDAGGDNLLVRRLSAPRSNQVAANGFSGALLLPPVQEPTLGTPRNGKFDDWVRLPPKEFKNDLDEFNNPSDAFPDANGTDGWLNKIGYVTYVQFMMDFGRERSPDVPNATSADLILGNKTPLSVHSPDNPRHNETVAGQIFSFPPRTQPMHAMRRALIAGIELVKSRNAGLQQGDRVSIVTFDGQDAYHAPQIVVPLTADYLAAQTACTNLQATADIGATTSTEAGLIVARQHLEDNSSATNPANNPFGAQGRPFARKVIVLLTDGLPNAWQSSSSEIDSYIGNNPHVDFYDTGYDWFNSVLMQTSRFQNLDMGALFPVGVGLGTDYSLMDRISRIAATDIAGQSPRGSGNPAIYEARLRTTLSEIVRRPSGRLAE